MTSAPRVNLLHLTDHNRGGSQRHILDLTRCATSVRHYVLRSAPGAVDVVDVAAARLLALDTGKVAGETAGVARTVRDTLSIGCLHAHALEPLLDLAEAPEQPLEGLPIVVTLHDLRVVAPRFYENPSPAVAPDLAWIARCAPVLHSAARVIVPSAYLRDVVAAAYPGIEPVVVPNGIAAPVPLSAGGETPAVPIAASRRVFAVVGALGAHKGARMLDRVVAAIDDPDVVGVVIGYTDREDASGWLIPDKLYLHGRYESAELPALLAAYRSSIAYFPNVVPESFSYVLSEVWQAGVPALVPDIGALGERMRDVGGGWLIDEPDSPERIAQRIVELLDPRASAPLDAARERIALSASAVPRLDTMGAALAAVYRDVGTTSADDADAGWLRATMWLASARVPGLDSSLLDAQWPQLAREEQSLRRWNSKLVSDVAAMETGSRALQGQFERSVLRQRALEADIEALKSRNARVEAEAAAASERASRYDRELTALAERNRGLEHDIVAIGRRNVELEQHVVALRERNVRVEADVAALVARNLQLEGDVVALTGRNIQLSSDVVALKERNTLVEAGLAAIGQRNLRVEQDAAALQRELTAARERLAAIERELAQRIARYARLERVLARLPRSLQNRLLPDA